MARFKAVWVDSDILLDALLRRQPWDDAATALLERAALGEWELWVSPLILANIYYIHRKHAGVAQARAALENLLRVAKTAPMNAAHVQAALDSGQTDFEDALQIACAAAAPGLDAIITRNLAHYRHAPLPVLTAEAWIEQNPRPAKGPNGTTQAV